MKKTLMEIQQGGGLRCANEGLLFAGPEEVWEKFKGKFEGWEEALKNTLEVAEKTVDNFELLEGKDEMMVVSVGYVIFRCLTPSIKA